jgi:1-pyrroline-4-hydroxy-2-carboxylate deaminase
VRIAVIGAGVAGLVAAHRLSDAGHAVDVYERWPGLGGQAATLEVGGGHRLERYYHHLFTTDRHIAALSTDEACGLARAAAGIGCAGLMVLPPYVYSTDWREMGAHVSAVIAATDLPYMLYNNPIAYRTDFRPEHVAELAAAHPNLTAVKESSADIRRIAAIRHRLGDRLKILVGVDDVIVEGIAAGATGWVAGLVNAMPVESVRLFDLATRANSADAATAAGARAAADRLYAWFLPLLTLDTVPKFIQLIKLVQQQVGQGHERVRAPRLVLAGAEREETLALIAAKLATRPANDA